MAVDGGLTRTYGVRIARSDILTLPRHRDAPTGQSWRSWLASLDGPVAVDLFCGAGGLSYGLESAGCTVALAVDTDERALETHRANFPGRALSIDLGDPDRVEDLVGLLAGLDIDILSGGPPCQPFSRAGRSKIRSLVAEGVRPAVDLRRELWRAFAQVAVEVRPRAILMENVPDMALGDDGRVIRDLAETLGAAGYEVDARLLDAWRYGVPQHRQRLILVALRDGGEFRWPTGRPPVNVADAIADLPSLGDGTGARSLTYSEPQTPFQRTARIGMTGDSRRIVWDHMTRAVRDDDREAFELMDARTSYADLPQHLRRYGVDSFDDKYNRLGWDELSRSITAHIAKDGYWYIHPGEPRTLTVREAARLQTFPDKFRFAGSRSHAFTQIGNAVPPRLAATVAREILRSLDHEPSATMPTAEGASSRRRRIRGHLADWLNDTKPSPWARTGDPWAVLVSVLCGRNGSGDALAEDVLVHWPTPAAAADEPDSPTDLGTSRDRRRLIAVSRAGQTVADHGWNDNGWSKLPGVGPAAARWVRAVGLRGGDVVATTGSTRVITRLEMGRRRVISGANARLMLAQLLGADDLLAGEVTAAIGLIGSTICLPRHPKCQSCPLAADCRGAAR